MPKFIQDDKNHKVKIILFLSLFIYSSSQAQWLGHSHHEDLNQSLKILYSFGLHCMGSHDGVDSLYYFGSKAESRQKLDWHLREKVYEWEKYQELEIAVDYLQWPYDFCQNLFRTFNQNAKTSLSFFSHPSGASLWWWWFDQGDYQFLVFANHAD